MTDFTTIGRIRYTLRATSDPAPVNQVIELDLGLDYAHLTKVFLGVQMFNSMGQLTTAGGGDYTVEIKTLNTQLYEPLEGKSGSPKPTIEADAPTTNTWIANTIGVRVTPSGVSSPAATYRVVLTANRT